MKTLHDNTNTRGAIIRTGAKIRRTMKYWVCLYADKVLLELYLSQKINMSSNAYLYLIT